MNEPNKSATKTKSYTIASFYNKYLSEIEKDTIYDIDYFKYRGIVTEYFKYLQDQVIEKGRQVKLPYRLGTLQIVKHKPKYYDSRSLRIDYKATKELNKLILHDNQHSDMFKYRAYWNKQDTMFINKSKYMLVLTRANKRRLAQLIKTKQMDYIEI